jgi:CO/xanthine dehydrogenase FAD-binding subunit
MGSLDTLAEVARQTEHPRAYEVLSKAIKDIADTTDKLMALQKNKKELEKDDKANGTGVNTTNNNLFVGSTTELQKLLRDANKNEEKAIIDVDAKAK